ncbi:alpha/beta hydrolase [Kribbella sp. NPDC026611]|uniref:alpha/beta fold hydrolase n=1 Tax=Kribbella sp. NPDC026611 TaxID=3154911 RepID=UPI0033EE0530
MTSSYLLLHGGGGVATMQSFGNLLATHTGADVLVPTHPGFGGTDRPADLTSVPALAQWYADQLDGDVTVIGNSFGGWLAAELALTGSPAIARVVLLDAIGIEVPGHPITDVSKLTLPQIQALSWHDPSKAPGASGPSPDIQALIGYTGPTMSDPALLDRLRGIAVPTQVLWGDSDGIVDPEYGKAYAAAIPGASFALVPRSGHLPQLETPGELLELLG